ncbi:hypothetical protein GW814_02445 [Candidatus Falkowbacteria bacterium]|nr:hypothetical protein [Candidatus Falkowbacteria bacterium]OIP78786.1 MAG: hypothetical protein AUK20_03165 [Parcubacteria group bacterium CG2_30_45_37]
MNKKLKVLLLLLAVLLLLVLYLILTSESAREESRPAPAKNEAAVQLENNYTTEAKELFNDYSKMVQADSFTLEGLAALKNKILDLKVPTKFKELHINLVLALTKMENYLNSRNEQEKIFSQQMVNQLKADYSWLNN